MHIDYEEKIRNIRGTVVLCFIYIFEITVLSPNDQLFLSNGRDYTFIQIGFNQIINRGLREFIK